MPKYFHITYTGIYEGTFEDFIDKTDKVDDAMDEQFGDEWVGGADGDYDIEREFAHIIRCRDCRHYDKSEDTPYCLRAMWWQDEGDDWFCAGAERGEE